MSVFAVGWYVIYTKSRHERKVAMKLSQLEINYFLPTIKTLRSWHDRRKYIDTPLFPSYVFVYLNNFKEYFATLGIGGVSYYVNSGKDVARLNNKVIEDLRMVVERGNEIQVSLDDFKIGQRMLIREGPMTGLQCEVVTVKGEKKILVRVNLLKRNLLVSVTSNHLVPIADNEIVRYISQ